MLSQKLVCQLKQKVYFKCHKAAFKQAVSTTPPNTCWSHIVNAKTVDRNRHWYICCFL